MEKLAKPAREGCGTALEPHAADRFVVGWHVFFYGMLSVATALALAQEDAGQAPMLFGALGLAAWYWLTVVRQPQRWERPLPMLPYFAGLAAAYVFLTGYSDAFHLLIWVMYPQVFTYLGRGWGSFGAVVVTALWGWRTGLIATIPDEPTAALSLVGSAAVAILIGVFIWSVVVQSEQRQQMITALDRTRGELRQAAERNEALLTETREALEDRNALFDASVALSSARATEEVVAAVGVAVGGGIDRVVLVRGPLEAAHVLAQWSRGRGLPGLDGVLTVPESPLPERATTWSLEALDPAAAAAWRRAGCGALVVLPLGDAADRVRDTFVLTTGRVEKISHTQVELFEALGAAAALALENLRLVERARVAGVLDERVRLAREIHDTLAQGFTSVVMQLEAAEADLDAGRDVRAHLDRARATARESLVAVRRTVRDLRPDLLDDASLPDALARTARRATERWGFQAGTRTTGASRPLHPDVEVTLLRVAQEALANAAHHAAPHRVRLTLAYHDRLVTVEVHDDGIGFDPSAPVVDTATDPARGGFGLRAMRERVEALGGHLSVESEPGAGTSVVATVPVAAASDHEPSVRGVDNAPTRADPVSGRAG